VTDRVVIRSFHRVFETDRRIYSIERGPGRDPLPISVMPNGIPLPGIYLFAAAEITVIVLSLAPGLGTLVELLPPLVRFVMLPLAVAVAGLQPMPDGRSAPVVALSWLGWRARQGRAAWGERAARPGPARVRAAWDADSPRLRACRVTGPARVGFRRSVRLTTRRGELTALRGHGHVMPPTPVGDGSTLRVR
jgi:hypothetical protein